MYVGGSIDAGLAVITMGGCTPPKFSNENGVLACDDAAAIADAVAEDIAASGTETEGEPAEAEAGGEKEGVTAADTDKEDL